MIRCKIDECLASHQVIYRYHLLISLALEMGLLLVLMCGRAFMDIFHNSRGAERAQTVDVSISEFNKAFRFHSFIKFDQNADHYAVSR